VSSVPSFGLPGPLVRPDGLTANRAVPAAWSVCVWAIALSVDSGRVRSRHFGRADLVFAPTFARCPLWVWRISAAWWPPAGLTPKKRPCSSACLVRTQS